MNQDKSKNLVELLALRAAEKPTETIYTFLVDGENETASLTYDEFDGYSRDLASRLQSLNLKKERELLLYPPGLKFITHRSLK